MRHPSGGSAARARARAGITAGEGGDSLRGFLGVFRYSRRALQLVWSTNRALTIGLAIGSIAAGLLPSGVAWVGKNLVDAIVQLRRGESSPDAATKSTATKG